LIIRYSQLFNSYPYATWLYLFRYILQYGNKTSVNDWLARYYNQLFQNDILFEHALIGVCRGPYYNTRVYELLEKRGYRDSDFECVMNEIAIQNNLDFIQGLWYLWERENLYTYNSLFIYTISCSYEKNESIKWLKRKINNRMYKL